MRFTVQRYESVPMLTSTSSTPNFRHMEESSTKKDTGHLRGTDNSNNNMKVKIQKVDPLQTGSNSPNSSSDFFTVDQSSPGHGFINSVAQRGRMFAKRQRRRLVNKTGDCNIIITNVRAKRRRYFVDIFTTMLDLQWRYNLLVFAFVFIGSWFIFASIWWIICIAHGDHNHKDDPEWTMCMSNVYDFQTALLFSIETQHTIGYGFRSMEPKCAEAFVVLMIQSALGVFMQSLVTGLIFAKISRPKTRARTILFSRNAVICKRDGEPCLLFRIGDMRKSHIVGTSIRAIMVKNRLTKEGEIIPICQVPLLVETETSLPGDNYIFLAWPVTVVHRINKESPLWNLSAEQLLEEKFELVVILDGTIETSGMTIQLRTSYLPTEILWGHHLAPLVAYQKEDGQYYVDFTMFHNTIPVEMDECSASSHESKLQEDKEANESPQTTPANFTFTATSLFSTRDFKRKKRRVPRNFHSSSANSSPHVCSPLKRSFSDKHCTCTKKKNVTPKHLNISPLAVRNSSFPQRQKMENIKELQSHNRELINYLQDNETGQTAQKGVEKEVDDLLLVDSDRLSDAVSVSTERQTGEGARG